jgi:integrase
MDTKHPSPASRTTAGIRQRHREGCTRKRCACPWQGEVFDARTGKKIRKSFPSKTAAAQWRRDAQAAIGAGRLSADKKPTLDEAFGVWLDGARDGRIRNASGEEYAPSSLRSYEQNYRLRVSAALGRLRLDEIRTVDVQDFIDELHARGVAPKTIRTAVEPVKRVYARALARDEVTHSPAAHLTIPRGPAQPIKPPAPGHGERLLSALPDVADAALWGTAMLAGLRRGELFALTWADVDLDAGLIRVARSYDFGTQTVRPPKSVNGIRSVPVADRLAPLLRRHKLASAPGEVRVFASYYGAAQRRADRAWGEAELERVTFHQCRHLYASMSIASGVNALDLCRFMGHGSIRVTLDRYGHLFPGSEREAAAKLDAYLAEHFVSTTGTESGT